MTTTREYRPSLGDRIGLIVFLVVGVAIIGWSGYVTALRLTEVLPGENVPVGASFVDLEAQAPIGPDGAMVPVKIDTAVVTADRLSDVALAGAVLGALITFITIATVIVCLMLLARNTLRGRVFSRGNTRLVTIAGMTGLLGFGLGPVFSGMAANETIARLSDRTFDDHAILVVDPMPYVVAGFVFAIVATAYTVGSRMQRETEGLV